jgi:hypothetical protein
VEEEREGCEMIFFLIIFSFFLLMYYALVLTAFGSEEYTEKRIFLLDLVPFFAIFRLGIKKFKELE